MRLIYTAIIGLFVSSASAQNIEQFNGVDSGIPLDTSTANAYPGPSDPSVGNVTRGHIVAPLDANVVFGGNGVFPLQVASPNPYAIGTAGTVASSTVGQTFSITFTSTHLTGSPITVTYTAIGGDTVSTIGAALCNVINANTTLHNALTSLPLFCQSINQSSPGLFNLQWDVSYTDMAIASVGTGTINFGALNRTLDFAVSNFGRHIPGYIGQDGDNIYCLQIMGQSVSGAMDAVVGNMCGTLVNAHGSQITGIVSFSASYNSAGHANFAIQNGMLLYDVNGGFPSGGFKGFGTLNIPATGAYFVDGQPTVQKSAGGGSASGFIAAGTSSASMAWYNPGGAADERWWDAFVAGSTWCLRAVADNMGSATCALKATRSGTGISAMDLNPAALTINGAATFTGTKTVRNAAGTGTCTEVFTKGLLTGGTC